MALAAAFGCSQNRIDKAPDPDGPLTRCDVKEGLTLDNLGRHRMTLPPGVAIALDIPVWLFLVVPVVGRFLIDFLNALNITVFLNFLKG